MGGWVGGGGHPHLRAAACSDPSGMEQKVSGLRLSILLWENSCSPDTHVGWLPPLQGSPRQPRLLHAYI